MVRSWRPLWAVHAHAQALARKAERQLAKSIAIGEVGIGVLLIAWLFTAIAAGLGATLNFSFMFSGSAGVNPALLLAQVLLVAGWRVAGYLVADASILPRIHRLVHRAPAPAAPILLQ